MGDQNIRYLVTSLLILLSTSLFSQSIPIQLMVVDQNGFEKMNQQVKLRLTLTNDTSSNTGQYQEVHFTSTNDFGIVSAALGTGIATTASSYLTFSLFPFTELEPFIKVELDTSLTSSQYFVAGTIKYSYPPIARRALVSDSSQVSSQSYESYHSLKSDTADYLSNFPVPNDNDSTNEIQSISLSQGGYLKLSNSIDSVEVNDNNPANELQSIILTESGHLKLSNSLDSVEVKKPTRASGPGSSDLANNNSSEYCYQGNPEVFPLTFLEDYTRIRPLLVFDNTAYFTARDTSLSTIMFQVNLYSGTILTSTNLGSSWVGGTWGYQNNASIGYLLQSNLFYTVDKTGIIDTTTSLTGSSFGTGISRSSGVAYPNSDFSFNSYPTRVNYDYSSGTLSSIPSSGKSWENGQGQAVGNDSVLIANILYNKNTMAAVRTFNNATTKLYNQADILISTTFNGFIYNAKYDRLYFNKAVGQITDPYFNHWYTAYTCDLSGSDELAITERILNNSFNSLSTETIDGINIFTSSWIFTTDQLAGFSFNGYHTSENEDLGLDINSGVVYPILNNSLRGGSYSVGNYQSRGKYTVTFSEVYGCATGSSKSTYYALLRWNR